MFSKTPVFPNNFTKVVQIKVYLLHNIGMKKLFTLFSALILSATLSGCKGKNKIPEAKDPILENCSIARDEKFGGALIKISIDDFNNLGFKFGDSLDLFFSNNVTYSDIGYYSGYYVPAGQELVVGYHSYPTIKFCINYGDDVYVANHFNNETTVTIKISQSQKYKDIEETLCIKYSDDITKYESKEQFANFREMNVGNIKPGLLYRGASPIDNQRKRASTVDELLNTHHILYDINLSDTRDAVNAAYNKEDFNSPYFKSLDDNHQAVLLGMAAAYKSDDFSAKMKTLFESILANDGPYYIHCLEGKDRTGYVCMVIEALCGASYDELVDDYFITYHNYYGIEKETEKYNLIKSIHIDEMIRFVFDFHKTTNLLTANYVSRVNDYLLAIGLTQEQIDAVQTKLSK